LGKIDGGAVRGGNIEKELAAMLGDPWSGHIRTRT
jgi:hypothetical protein